MKIETAKACAKEFIERFDASKDPDLWNTLLNEETNELQQAMADMLKEMVDVIYVAAGKAEVEGDDSELQLVIALFNKIVKPTKIEQAFWRVHASNMSKLGDDGKPIKREDGKILKGPNYMPPNLNDLINPFGLH